MFLFPISVILFGLAVFLFVDTVTRWIDSNRRRKKHPAENQRRFDSIFLRLLIPLAERLAEAIPVSSRLERCGYIHSKLIRAGLLERLSVKEFCAYHVLMIGLSLLISILLFKISAVSLLVAAVVGAAYPLLWLKSLEKKRGDEITYSLPLVLDTLTLSVEAGLDFMSAVGRIVERGRRSIVVDELRRMLNQNRLGMSRQVALNEFRERLKNPSVDSFVSMLIQADRLGASIGPILKAHAVKLRSDRFQSAERAGAAASQKLLIPLVFLIMPAVFVIIFGPLYLMWRSGAFEKLF